MNANIQKTIWKLLSNPTLEVAATLVVVMVAATWLVMQSDVGQGAFILFGRR